MVSFSPHLRFADSWPPLTSPSSTSSASLPPHVSRKKIPLWEPGQQVRFEEIRKMPIRIESPNNSSSYTNGSVLPSLDINLSDLLQFIGLALSHSEHNLNYTHEFTDILTLLNLFENKRTSAPALDVILAGGAATYTVIGQDFPYKDFDLVVYVPTEITPEAYQNIYKNLLANYLRMKLFEGHLNEVKDKPRHPPLTARLIRSAYFSDLIHFPDNTGVVCGLHGPRGLNISFIHSAAHYAVGVTTGWGICMQSGLVSCTDGVNFCRDEEQILQAYQITCRRLNPVPHPETVRKLSLRLMHRTTLGFQNEKDTVALGVSQLQKMTRENLTASLTKHQNSHYPLTRLAWVAEFITALSYAPDNAKYCTNLAWAWYPQSATIHSELAEEVNAISKDPGIVPMLLARVRLAAFLALGQPKGLYPNQVQAYRFFFMRKDEPIREQFAITHPGGTHYFELPHSHPVCIAKEGLDNWEEWRTKNLFGRFGVFINALGLPQEAMEKRSRSSMVGLFIKTFAACENLFPLSYQSHFYSYLSGQKGEPEDASTISDKLDQLVLFPHLRQHVALHLHIEAVLHNTHLKDPAGLLISTVNLWITLSDIADPTDRLQSVAHTATALRELSSRLVSSPAPPSPLSLRSDSKDSKEECKLNVSTEARTQAVPNPLFLLGQCLSAQPQLVEAVIAIIQAALFLQHYPASTAMPEKLSWSCQDKTYHLSGSKLSPEQLAVRAMQAWRLLQAHAQLIQALLSTLHITCFNYSPDGKAEMLKRWTKCFQRPAFRFHNFEAFFEPFSKDILEDSLLPAQVLDKWRIHVFLGGLIQGMPPKSLLAIKLRAIHFRLRAWLFHAQGHRLLADHIGQIGENFKSALVMAKQAGYPALKKSLSGALLSALPHALTLDTQESFFELFGLFQGLIEAEASSIPQQKAVATDFIDAFAKCEQPLNLEKLNLLHRGWKVIAKKLALEKKDLVILQTCLQRRTLAQMRTHVAAQDSLGAVLHYYALLQPMLSAAHFPEFKAGIIEVFSSLLKNMESVLQYEFERDLKQATAPCIGADKPLKDILLKMSQLALHLFPRHACAAISPLLQRLANSLIHQGEVPSAIALAQVLDRQTPHQTQLLIRCMAYDLTTPTALNFKALVDKLASLENTGKDAPAALLRLVSLLSLDFSERSFVMSRFMDFLLEYSLEIAEEALTFFREAMQSKHIQMSQHNIIFHTIKTGEPSKVERAHCTWLGLKPSTFNFGYLISGNALLSCYLASGENARLSEVVSGLSDMLEMQSKELSSWPLLRKKHVFEKLTHSLSFLLDHSQTSLVKKVWAQMHKCQLLHDTIPIPLNLLYASVLKGEILPGTWITVQSALEAKTWNNVVARLYFELAMRCLEKLSGTSSLYIDRLCHVLFMAQQGALVPLDWKSALLSQLLAAQKKEFFSWIWREQPELCQEGEICIKMLEAASKFGDDQYFEVLVKTVVKSELLTSKKFPNSCRPQAFSHLCSYLLKIIRSTPSKGRLDNYTQLHDAISRQASISLLHGREKLQVYDYLISIGLNIASKQAFDQTCLLFIAAQGGLYALANAEQIIEAAERLQVDANKDIYFGRVIMLLDMHLRKKKLLPGPALTLDFLIRCAAPAEILKILKSMPFKKVSLETDLEKFFSVGRAHPVKEKVSHKLSSTPRKESVSKVWSIFKRAAYATGLLTCGFQQAYGCMIARIAFNGTLMEGPHQQLEKSIINLRIASIFVSSTFISASMGYLRDGKKGIEEGFYRNFMHMGGAILLMTKLYENSKDCHGSFLYNALAYFSQPISIAATSLSQRSFSLMNTMETLSMAGIALLVDSCFQNIVLSDFQSFLNSEDSGLPFFARYYLNSALGECISSAPKKHMTFNLTC